jgi:nitrogen fixation protein
MDKFLSRLKILAENSIKKSLEEKVKKISSDGGKINLKNRYLNKFI